MFKSDTGRLLVIVNLIFFILATGYAAVTCATYVNWLCHFLGLITLIPTVFFGDFLGYVAGTISESIDGTNEFARFLILRLLLLPIQLLFVYFIGMSLETFASIFKKKPTTPQFYKRQ